MPKCATPHCDNEMQSPSTGLCHNCYNSVLGWSKRPVGETQDRVLRLAKYLERMQALIPDEFVKTQLDNLRPKKVKIKALPGTIKIKKKNGT